MGLGNKNANRKYVNLKINKDVDGKKEVHPRLILKENGQELEFDYISGLLTGIRKRTFMHEGREMETCAIDLYDPKEDIVYQVEMGITSLWRNIMNSLFSATKLGNVLIELYRIKSKKDDGKYFPGATVYVDNEKLEWKYSYKEDMAPLIETVIYKGKEEQDTFKLDKWVWAKIEEHIVPLLQGIDAKSYFGQEESIVLDEDNESMLDAVRRERAEREREQMDEDQIPEDDGLPF